MSGLQSNVQSNNGWIRLSNGFDVELLHGIPVVLSDNGLPEQDDEALIEEVSKLSGLKSCILDWHAGENNNEREATLCIDAMHFEDVLKRLAFSSAALFVERYHKPVTEIDVDWDKEEYDRDFNRALEHCCLKPGDFNKDDYYDRYLDYMHWEAQRLVNEGVSPLVEPE